MTSADDHRTQAVLGQLDDTVRQHLQRLLEEEPTPPGELREDVLEHIALLQREAEGHDFVDLDLARACAESLRQLIDDLEATPADSEAHRLVHAAVRYFILAEDAEDDIDSVIGFDDDAEVVSAVAVALGRTDLSIDVA